MGFFETLFEVVEYISGETADLLKGISEDTKQLGDELVHIYDDSYVSPYAKKKEATERIDRADRKMDNARSRYDNHIKRVEKRLEKNLKRKQELLVKSENEKTCGLSSKYSSYDYIDMDSVGFRNRIDFQVGEFWGIFGHSIMDEAATSYLEDAKDYEVEARRVCAKIENYDAKLSRIEEQMDIEEKLMDTLENQIAWKNMNDDVQAKQVIRNLLSIAICDKNGEIRQQYIQELDELKRFC